MSKDSFTSRLHAWLENLPIQDPVERRMASLLQVILIGFIIVILVAAALNLVIASELSWQVIFIRSFIFVLIIGIPLALLRRGYFRVTALVIIGIFLLLEAYAVTTTSLREIAETLSFFTLAIILAGLLVSRRALVLTFLCSAGAVGFSAFREQSAALGSDGLPIALNFILLNGLIALFLERFGVTLRTSLTDALEREGRLQREVAERKRAEENLRASEALVHSLVESMPLNVVSKDLQGRFIFANQHFSSAEGRPLAEIVGKTDFDLYPPELARKYREDDRRVMETGQTIDIEEEHQPLGSNKSFVQVIKTPLYDAGMQVVGVLVMHWDISERKRAEEKLQRQNRRLEALRVIDAAILAADSVENIVGAALEHIRELIDCERANLALIEWEKNEAVNFDVRDSKESAISKGARVSLDLIQDILHVLSRNQPVIIDDLITLPDPPPQIRIFIKEGLRSRCILPLFSQGNLIGSLTLSSEIPGYFDEEKIGLGLEVANQVAIALTQNDLLNSLRESNKELEDHAIEREKLIAELTAKNAELERFAYTVSHDLKSPLVTIKGFLGYLEQDAIKGNIERLKNDMQRIANAVDKMSQLLDDLLELSRIGHFVNKPEMVPFEELASDAIALLEGQIHERGVTLVLQPSLPAVYVDKPRLVEVLQNLIDNAIKYMGDQPDPRVEIGRRSEENGGPLFYVKDNGIGIAPEYQERVFGLFDKLDARSEGTGIGLALVKRIIEYHGGRIWVESETGKGSAFCFTLRGAPVST